MRENNVILLCTHIYVDYLTSTQASNITSTTEVSDEESQPVSIPDEATIEPTIENSSLAKDNSSEIVQSTTESSISVEESTSFANDTTTKPFLSSTAPNLEGVDYRESEHWIQRIRNFSGVN